MDPAEMISLTLSVKDWTTLAAVMARYTMQLPPPKFQSRTWEEELALFGNLQDQYDSHEDKLSASTNDIRRFEDGYADH